jgi:rRNA maturation RNase YbeY
MAIRFFSEDIQYNLPHPRKTSAWIKKSIIREHGKLYELTFIFCSDRYLYHLNMKFLKHNTLTDIITFDLSEGSGVISGEIYISIDRVKENANDFKRTFDEEIHRVIIHGVLHLLGFKDKKPGDKAVMREKEEACLSLR